MLLKKPFAALLLLVFLGGILYAQDDDEGDEAPIESDWGAAIPGAYSRGDQTFSIGLGLMIPLFYYLDHGGFTGDMNMGLGGMGALGYNYFFSSHLFIGGELSGAFFGTEGENSYYIVPMGFRVGWQFIFRRFEFPLSFLLGIAPQRRLNDSYLGLFAKPTAGAFFRFNSDWSFGVNAAIWWVPQFHAHDVAMDRYVNDHGFFLELGVAARYHF
jgi:hypothetical protein